MGESARLPDRLGGIENPTMEPIMAAPSPLRYRNKADSPWVWTKTGTPCWILRAPQSPDHPLPPLPIATAIFDEIAAVFLQWVKKAGIPCTETEHCGVLRHLYLRYAVPPDR